MSKKNSPGSWERTARVDRGRGRARADDWDPSRLLGPWRAALDVLPVASTGTIDFTHCRPRPPLALSEPERRVVLEVLHSERFVDAAPRQIYASLLDEGRYLCSVRTIYRILEAEQELRERRNQCRRPVYTKPELLATGPNQVWSWDITRLKGPAKWTYFYLYVILDIFSRYVVGWMVARRESATLAKRLVTESLDKQGIVAEQLTLHADRGSSMTAKSLALLLAELG